jgi:hypothetical protein
MKEEGNRDPKDEINNYLRYSGLGLQLLITILVAGWIGYKIDGYLDIKFPAFMLLLGFLAFAGSLYQVYRKIKKE